MQKAKAAKDNTPRCIAVSCKAPVAFRFLQLWNDKVKHACAAHVPGNLGGKVPNPASAERRGAYVVEPV